VDGIVVYLEGRVKIDSRLTFLRSNSLVSDFFVYPIAQSNRYSRPTSTTCIFFK